jgi:hypothetical protein
VCGVRNRFGKSQVRVRPASRNANNSGRDARRRRVQGCDKEKRQYRPAPCAPALFIGPSARSASRAMPAQPARTTSQSKQRLDGYARVGSVVKSPDLAVAIRATFSGH